MLIRYTHITMALFAVLVSAATASARQQLGLDWKVTSLSPADGAAFYEKSGVKISCEWNASIATTGQFKQATWWSGRIVVDGSTIRLFSAMYDPNDSAYWYTKPGTHGDKQLPWQQRPVYGTATNEFHGSVEATWTAKGVGPHTVGCTIAISSMGGNMFESASHTANNSKQVSIVVNPMNQVTPGRFPNAPDKQTKGNPPQKAVQPTVPKPSLSIVGAQAKHDPGCASLANLITVQVKIQNSNIPLATGKGSVLVKENGGANLASSFQLPAFAANEVKVLQLAVGTQASFVGALPGKHQLSIALNPVMSGGQPSFAKPADYQLAVTLPAGYCAGR